MVNNKIKKIFCVFFLIGFTFLSFGYKSQADMLDSWQDMDAYKPNPILFLHGFAFGSASSWSTVKSELNDYFDDYSATFNFLETIDFNDPNGSIDTYPDGSYGWADKVDDKVSGLLSLDKYGSIAIEKLNLVCHSMGGLAAREYVSNPKYGSSGSNIDKIITIGTPHAGTPLANVTIEKAIIGVNKYIWEVPYFGKTQVIFETNGSDPYMMLVRGVFKIDFNGEAVKDMAVGSPFLLNLNNRPQPTNIKNFAIYGGAYSLISEQLNFLFFSLYYPDEPFTCGDGLVPRDSQKGYDIMTYYPSDAFWVWKNISDIGDVKADHLGELSSSDTPSKILSFLDSAKPEFEITSPNPNVTTEIYESSIHIKGKVYEEYLPADSHLIINVERQEDGYKFSPPESYLKPSDLWIPNDADSPVAEFDEVVTFPGKGTYKISCQVKNPAGEVSEIKDVWVKVLYEGTNIIVHCHNPEGKEIGSILTIVNPLVGWQNDPAIYDGDMHIGNGASRIEDHNRPIPIDPGNHTIKAVFNGMTLQQDIDISEGETEILTFTFERTEFDIAAWLDTFDDGDNTFERSGEGYIEWLNTFDEELTKELSSGSIAKSEVHINTIEFFPTGRRDYSYHNRIVQTFNSTTYKNETYAQLTISGKELLNLNYSSIWVDGSGSQPTYLPTYTSFTYWFCQYKENYRYPKISLMSGDIEYPIIWNRYNYDPPYLTGHEVWAVPANINYTSAMWKGWAGYAIVYPNSELEETLGPYTLTDIKMSSIPYDLEEIAF